MIIDFTIAPLAMMATAHIELPQLKLKQEMVLVVLIAQFILFFLNYNLLP
jgi:hypothetical protein